MSTPVTEHRGVTLDPSALLGTWRNTNAASRGIVRIDLERAGSAIALRAFGADEPEPCNWGRVPARMYGDRFDANQALALDATYNRGLLEVHLQANVKTGVLVVASFTRVLDGSSANRYTREFYYRLPEREGPRP